jgi:threonine aldolase
MSHAVRRAVGREVDPMSRIADLRSDTLTRPTAGMRAAMAAAEVGDDVFGEDPTVLRLEERAAAIAGKEAAVYVPSGTMANELAIRSQADPGDEILLERNAHVFDYESGAAASICGVMPRQIPGNRGVITWEQIEAHLRGENEHYAPVSMVLLENTHNRAGGAIFPLAEMQRIGREAVARGLRVHIDGARIFNAVVATGIPASDYAACGDTISFCFSKGLGAPVGSALVGSHATIKRARRFRKMFGGGMRQAGIIAAGALYALERHVGRLAEDHARARRLAAGIARVPGFHVENDPPDTNMVYVQVAGAPGGPGTDPLGAHPGGGQAPGPVPPGPRTAPEVCAALKALGVLCLPVSPFRIRLVVHLDVDEEDIDRATAGFREVAAVRG